MFSESPRSRSFRPGAITSPSFESNRWSSEPNWPLLPVSKIVRFIRVNIGAEVPVVYRRVWGYGRLSAKARDCACPIRFRGRRHSKECRVHRKGHSNHCICKETEQFL